MSIISVKNVFYSYENTTQGGALSDVSFDVEKGEFVCILGHNGSGKSTLAKLLNGLYTPTEGKVYINGTDTLDESKLLEIRKTAGMVFQNPDNQMVAAVVEEDVAFGPENLGVPHEQLRGRVDDALNAVNMLAFAKSAPHRLSGGQKQRVAIAGVLAMLPEILILDEPTAMLDPRGRQEVLETVHRLNKEQKMTVVHITHFMEEAVGADRIIILSNGKIAMQGTPEQVFSQEEKIRELTLEIPRAARIARELREKGIDIDESVLTVDALTEEICRLI